MRAQGQDRGGLDRSHTEPHTLLAAQYENTLHCIRCALCLPACPTYQETFDEAESPRGRIAMVRAYTEGHLDFTADLRQHMDSCLLCDACSAVCPSGVQMELLGIAFRAATEARVLRPAWRRLGRRVVFDYVFGSLSGVHAVADVARLYRGIGLQAAARRTGVLRRFGVASAEALLPNMREPFLIPRGQVWPALGKERLRVGLFAGCVMSTAFSSVDRSTARVLAAQGCRVVAVPGQGCCGALHLHNGELEGAKALARRNVDAFGRLPIDAIAVNAAGCSAAMKHYGELLADDPDYAHRAARIAATVRDVTELLAEIGVTAPMGQLPLTVTYQEPCHLVHIQRIREAPRALLKSIPGLKLIEMEESTTCCGSAGIYSIAQPAMSSALMRRKVARVLATGADVVVSANAGCMMQLAAGLSEAGAQVAVKHIVELLDEALPRSMRDGQV